MDIPRSELSNAPLNSSFLVCIVVLSAPIVGVPSRFDAAYLSMVEGFRRRPAFLGLSDVVKVDTGASEGVRVVGGGGRAWLWRDTDGAIPPAEATSESCVTEALFDAAGTLYTVVIGTGALVALSVP